MKHYACESPFLMKDKEGNKYNLTIIPDDNPTNPRDWDNIAKIWCWKRDYIIGDTPYGNVEDSLNYLCKKYTNMSEEEIENTSIRNMIEKLKISDNLTLVSIYCYEHSGITISTSTEYPYNDKWDSSMIGFAFIDKETAFKNFGGIPLKDENGNYKRIPLTEENWKQRAKMCIDSEVETLDMYLQGEVYGFNLTKIIIKQEKCPHCGKVIKEYEDKEDVDSCWEFYGSELETNGILDNLGDLKFVED